MRALKVLLSAIATLTLVLTAGVTHAHAAAVVTAAPTYPVTITTSGPPPIPALPAAGDTAPSPDQINDPVTAAASCVPWYQQSRYGQQWPATSTWWEYRCSYENVYYSNPCTSGACNAFCWYCYWETQVWTDYFYWDGSAAVFYGEVYSDNVVWEGDLAPPSLTAGWWDAATAGWYALAPTLSVSTSGRGAGEVSSDPAGIACGTTCQTTFDPGSTVTLTASPDASSVFAGWSGDCTGSGACQVTIDQAHSVQAVFDLKTFQLTVATAGPGHGLVYMNPGATGCDGCREPYDFGTRVTLTASPDTSAVFTGWMGDCTGTGACQVTMNQAHSVTANFALNSPPRASFTVICTALSCTFDGRGSADSDGNIAAYIWDFGDGSPGSGPTLSHTYVRPGNYTATLTVTDNAAASRSTSISVWPITLAARGYKQNGLQKVQLSWTGPSGVSFDVYRSSIPVATVPANAYTDNLNKKGSGTYTYQVCEAAIPVCSNTTTVRF
jgi:hypothetical protein